MTRPAAVPGVGEREAFEAWYGTTRKDGDYKLAWSAWQAALSAAPGLPAPGPGQRDGSYGLPRTGTASLSDVEHRGGEKP